MTANKLSDTDDGALMWTQWPLRYLLPEAVVWYPSSPSLATCYEDVPTAQAILTFRAKPKTFSCPPFYSIFLSVVVLLFAVSIVAIPKKISGCFHDVDRLRHGFPDMQF